MAPAPTTYYDCKAQGTIDQGSAQDACAAYAGTANCDLLTCNNPVIGGVNDVVCNDLGNKTCACWAFANSTNGVAGHAVLGVGTGINNCRCPGAAAPPWN
jgi:hypothetical protein